MKILMTILAISVIAVLGLNIYKEQLLAFVNNEVYKRESPSAIPIGVSENIDVDDSSQQPLELDGTNNPANRNTDEVVSVKIEN